MKDINTHLLELVFKRHCTNLTSVHLNESMVFFIDCLMRMNQMFKLFELLFQEPFW